MSGVSVGVHCPAQGRAEKGFRIRYLAFCQDAFLFVLLQGSLNFQCLRTSGRRESLGGEGHG